MEKYFQQIIFLQVDDKNTLASFIYLKLFYEYK